MFRTSHCWCWFNSAFIATFSSQTQPDVLGTKPLLPDCIAQKHYQTAFPSTLPRPWHGTMHFLLHGWLVELSKTSAHLLLEGHILPTVLCHFGHSECIGLAANLHSQSFSVILNTHPQQLMVIVALCPPPSPHHNHIQASSLVIILPCNDIVNAMPSLWFWVLLCLLVGILLKPGVTHTATLVSRKANNISWLSASMRTMHVTPRVSFSPPWTHSSVLHAQFSLLHGAHLVIPPPFLQCNHTHLVPT